jgi:hypothetical protein
MSYEPTEDALQAGWETIGEKFSYGDGQMTELLQAAIAIDRKAIALDFIQEQWVTPQTMTSIVEGDEYLIVLEGKHTGIGCFHYNDDGEQEGNISGWMLSMKSNPRDDAQFDDDYTWLRALPLKALGV